MTWRSFLRRRSGRASSAKAGCQAASQEEREAVRTLRERTRSSSTYFTIRLLQTIWMLDMEEEMEEDRGEEEEEEEHLDVGDDLVDEALDVAWGGALGEHHWCW